MLPGILLVGHGTRQQAGVEEFLATARRLAERLPQQPVEPCFLELAEPTIDAGVARLAEREVRQMIVVPLLLFAAGHAKRDIPHAVLAAAARYPGMEVRFASHLGCHEKLLTLSKLRMDEALAGRDRIEPRETALVMIGRGALDDDALAEMRAFADLRAEQGDAHRVETCYLAMAQPRLAECLAQVDAWQVKRVVLQPHLLFRGDLLNRVASEAARLSHERPLLDVVIADRLGPHPLLVELLTELIALAATE